MLRFRSINNENKKVGIIIQQWLFNVIFAALIVTLVAVIAVQVMYQRFYSYSVTEKYVLDVSQDIDKDFDLRMREYIYSFIGIESEYMDAYYDDDILADMVLRNQNVLSEINIVDPRGIIIHSSDPRYVGYDMRSGEQSAEFLCLLEGAEYYVQDLQIISFDDDTKRKYVGVPLPDDNGFIQMGISEEIYHTLKNNVISESIRNRFIGMDGFVVVCSMDMNVIGSTDDLLAGRSFDRPDYLPETEGECKSLRGKLLGQDCYIVSLSRPDYYIIGAFPVSETGRMGLINVILTIGMISVIMFCIFICLTKLLNKHVVSGIEDINESLTKITGGDLTEKAEVSSSLEFKELSDGINHTVDRLKDMIEEADARVEKELEFAKRIQTSAVPNVFPPFPDNEAFGLYALMDTAKAVGGDFYDFFMLDEHTLALVIADVSDKGMPAALFMMKAKTLIKTYAEEGLPIEEVATNANLKLCEENDAEMFVTAWLGFLDLRTGIIEYVHAGHTYPILINKDGAGFVKNKKNLMLGSMSRAKYIRQEIKLENGDILFLYTDGVTEARSTEGVMYGEKRLLELLTEKTKELKEDDRNQFSRDACCMVFDDVKAFAGTAEQSDDITMLWFTLERLSGREK